MAGSASSLYTEQVTSAQVDRRIEDWLTRLASLYDEIESWLPAGRDYAVSRDRTVPMYEDPMRQFDKRAIELPILEIVKDGEVVVAFEPVGLWTIGGNGRVDVITRSDIHILSDLAEPFRKPRWHLFSAKQPVDGEPFKSKAFRHLLRE